MRKLTLFILLSLLSTNFNVFAQAGYITTIAGTGVRGFSGDGGAATAATMGHAMGVAVDRIGNVYIYDNDTGRMRKVTPDGIITTFAGGGSSTADGVLATNASISLGAITTDAINNVFFVDGNRIRKIDITTNIVTTVAGTGAGGFGGDGGTATAAQISSPHGICFDNSGNLYIGDEYNHRIRKVNTAGIISTFAGTGVSGYSGDGGPATAAQLNSPDGLCFDVFGNMYVADRYNYVIRKIDNLGFISTYAGSGSSGGSGDGGLATIARFFEPSYVCTDSYGNIYVADFHNSRVRKIDVSGIITAFAGGGSSMANGVPATTASFSDVWCVTSDIYDNIYVADRYHYRICKVGAGFPSTITDSFSVIKSISCTGINFNIITNIFSSGQHLKTYFNDTLFLDTLITSYGTRGICSFFKPLNTGVYNIKHVLYIGTTAKDSITYNQNFSNCQNFMVKFYYDINGNCVKDTSDVYSNQQILVEVDSNALAIDTISALSGFNYLAYGTYGDVYSFKVISTPSAFHVTCPLTGIIYDTLTSTLISNPKNVGINCSGTSGFDLAVNAIIPVTGVRDEWGSIYVKNNFCSPTDGTLTLTYSPKYSGTPDQIRPAAAAVSGNTIVWNLSALTSTNSDIYLHYSIWSPSSSSLLSIRDTVQTSITITPILTDADPTNNYMVIIDTVKGGCDPNEMWVSPNCFDTGTGPAQLKYTINFENTGNDTAHNIYVMDTLSDLVDISTMRLEMSSHEMYISKLKDTNGHNILKFDFPNINLLDSSHHGFCDGAVIFNIKSKSGLPDGTYLYNKAGIYFDVNPVVMTNQVATVVGCEHLAVQTPHIESAITLYPNPTTNRLTIKTENNAFTTFTITNMIGQEMMQHSITGTETNVDVAKLPTGVYYVIFIGEGGEVVKRFVKM